MTAILEARNLDTYYGRVQILHDLNLEIKKGDIAAIIGPNGAGKSTALKALFGLVPAKRGQVILGGEDVTNESPQSMVRRGVCFVPQGRAVFPSLSVEENLRMGAYVLGDRELERQRAGVVFDRFPRLRERRRQAAGSLSGGEQQMLAMGRALMVEPQVLLLDEPSVGLAPKVVAEILASIKEINAAGTTVVVVEQNAVMALQTADYAYLLVMGRNRMEGKGAELLGDQRVQEVYLGAPAKKAVAEGEQPGQV